MSVERADPAIDKLFQQVQEGKVFRKPGDLRIYAKGHAAHEALQEAGVQTVRFAKGVVLINQGSLREKLAAADFEVLKKSLSPKHHSTSGPAAYTGR